MPYKQGVTGSNPVSPTDQNEGVRISWLSFLLGLVEGRLKFSKWLIIEIFQSQIKIILENLPVHP